MNALSFEERSDALIALSILFEQRISRASVNAVDRPMSDIVAESLSGIDSARRGKLLERAKFLESLADAQRHGWLGRWVDNIRRRGRSTKLDQNINAEQIVQVLRKEPHRIRRNILNYLPMEVGSDVERLLGSGFSILSAREEHSNELPPEIVDVIKDRFLANFVQFESVCDANALDSLSAVELTPFVRHLGLREIAVACRGIRSREKIAAFLCRFAEDDAKAIAMYLSNLDRIGPVWVATADLMVRRLWSRRLRPHQIIHKIGLELLACAFAERSDTAIQHTTQKLPFRDSKRWEKMCITWNQRLADPDVSAVETEIKRARAIVLMAGKFKKTRSLL